MEEGQPHGITALRVSAFTSILAMLVDFVALQILRLHYVS